MLTETKSAICCYCIQAALSHNLPKLPLRKSRKQQIELQVKTETKKFYPKKLGVVSEILEILESVGQSYKREAATKRSSERRSNSGQDQDILT